MEPISDHQTKYYLKDLPDNQKVLCIEGDPAGFDGRHVEGILQCPLSAGNAAALRDRFPWLNPQPLGLATSFGFGDRLGLATAGHIQAVRGSGVAPIFAQQSVRENSRTGRNPQIVLDDAMWAVFEADWREPWGADADHVKEIEDLGPFISAGYSFYTFDPNQYVDDRADSQGLEVLRQKAAQLPWEVLGISLEGLVDQFLGATIRLDGEEISFNEIDFYRALGKYGRAIAHIKTLSDYLTSKVQNFDLEVSVDETDTPTSVLEHYYIASELRRLQVPFVSLAPRFIGSFEKGVDYIGDLEAFDRELERHARVMRAIGGYKLSVHTGSDKFSIYPSIAAKTGNLVHVKTAGTSYLEALRVMAVVDEPFFREILDFSRGRYDIDRATYHVSGRVEQVPPSENFSDGDLLKLFDDFDARQVLHVTFGSVLDHYGERLIELLKTHQSLYDSFLQAHFEKHLSPFARRDTVSYQHLKQVGFLFHPACPAAEAVPGLTCCPQALLPVTPTVVCFKILTAECFFYIAAKTDILESMHLCRQLLTCRYSLSTTN